MIISITVLLFCMQMCVKIQCLSDLDVIRDPEERQCSIDMTCKVISWLR